MIVQSPPADALSDVLASLRARARCSISLVAGGDWAVGFHPPAHLKVNVLRRGACWLLAEGADSARLAAGDCVVIAGAAFTLASAPDVAPVPAREVFAQDSLAARIGAGEDVSILGGSVEVDPVDGAFLTGALPPVMVIRGGAAASISWLLAELDREWDSTAPGARLICSDLLRMIFVHALRSRIASDRDLGVGWFAGLADPRIARALHALHADPTRGWTVEALAREAGQSRSAFAAAFRRRLGQTPMDYLAAWRMRLAAVRLRATTQPIATIAADLGYASDSAFSASFRRLRQVSPARYRRSQRPDQPAGA